MKDYLEAEKRDQKRRRRERYLIISLFFVISILLFAGVRVFGLGIKLPLSGSILVFVLININVILLLLLLFLTVRNLVKLLFERKRNIMGAKLRTKLVLAFVSLSLLPTIVLFFASVQFISSSIDYWFKLQIEESLKNSLEVGHSYYEQIGDDLLSFGNNIGRVITYEGFMLLSRQDELERFVHEKRKEYYLASLKVYSLNLGLRTKAEDHRIHLSSFKDPGEEMLREVSERGTDEKKIQSSPHGDLISGIVPVFSRTESKAVVGVIVLSKFIPASFVTKLRTVSRGLQEYRQLKMLKKPFKISHLIWLSIVTLLIIFSSVWFGFYLSREITIPIKELAEGTKRVAAGDYDFSIDLEAQDEIGVLVNSFNRMTTDLKISKTRFEDANQELKRSNIELEQRRLYMEIVLANVGAGVISADAEGRVSTINKSAEEMLNIRAEDIVGKDYRDVLPEDYIKWINAFFYDKGLMRKGTMNKQISLSVKDKTMTMLVSLNVLRDEKDRYLGLVAVLEDLTEIQKAQRMAAWREVARRIAHEVKNPLTPIQLSAQRLKKKYGKDLLGDDLEVFRDCTDMIITQVEELKQLVDEFSNFARMPASNPAPSDISTIIREALNLYREAHKEMSFNFNDSNEVPVFNFDREQIKRAMINLLDNAIEATDGRGEVEIELRYDATLYMVIIEVADNGRGIAPDHKTRLFEPYFSTKKHGTGLGLSIVDTIITDHSGFVRVQDNKPKGTRFIIELPARAA